MTATTQFILPKECFTNPPADELEIVEGKPGIDKREAYSFPVNPSEEIVSYIAENFILNSRITGPQVTLLARALGENAHAWKILLDKYNLADRRPELFMRLFSNGQMSDKPNLSSVDIDTAKLCEIFGKSELNSGSRLSNVSIFERLGFAEYDADILNIRIDLYSWLKRIDSQNPGSVKTLTGKLSSLRSDFPCFTRDEKISFIKAAVTSLLEKGKAKRIAQNDLFDISVEAEFYIKLLQDKNAEIEISDEELKELQDVFEAKLDEVFAVGDSSRINKFGPVRKTIQLMGQPLDSPLRAL